MLIKWKLPDEVLRNLRATSKNERKRRTLLKESRHFHIPTTAERQLQRKYYIMRRSFLQALLENDDERMEPMTNEERKMFKTFINMREEIAMNR